MAHSDSSIRVLLVAPGPEIIGGQSVQAQQLLAELRRVPSLSVGFRPIGARLPGVLAGIPYLRTILRFLLYLPALLFTIPRYDIVHVFAASYWSYTLWSMPAILIGRLCRKKAICHYHSGEAEDHLANWRSAIPSLMLCHEIVVPSGYLAHIFTRFGLETKPIFNILDANAFPHRRRERLRPVFLTNRGLEPLYNVGCVLRAFQIIQRHYPEASLVVAHDGSCRAQLEALAAELRLRNTRFIGQVAPDRMGEVYDAADIYLMSPDLDCMPGSVLECFAAGLPVVSTKAGGVPFIVKHEQTGLLVGCGDHQGLAECAMWLLEDHRMALRMADRGYRECAKYRAGAVRDIWVALYHTLAGEPLSQDEEAAVAAALPR